MNLIARVCRLSLMSFMVVSAGTAICMNNNVLDGDQLIARLEFDIKVTFQKAKHLAEQGLVKELIAEQKKLIGLHEMANGLKMLKEDGKLQDFLSGKMKKKEGNLYGNRARQKVKQDEDDLREKSRRFIEAEIEKQKRTEVENFPCTIL